MRLKDYKKSGEWHTMNEYDIFNSQARTFRGIGKAISRILGLYVGARE